jgi:hypothetical protein
MSRPPSDAAKHYIFKFLNMKTALKLKITMFQIYLELNINPIKPSTALINLERLPLKQIFLKNIFGIC